MNEIAEPVGHMTWIPAAVITTASLAWAGTQPVLPPATTRDEQRGRDLIESVCSLCHELDRIHNQRLTREGWRGMIAGMLAEGAPVTEEEMTLIVNYLAKNFGVKAQ